MGEGTGEGGRGRGEGCVDWVPSRPGPIHRGPHPPTPTSRNSLTTSYTLSPPLATYPPISLIPLQPPVIPSLLGPPCRLDSLPLMPTALALSDPIAPALAAVNPLALAEGEAIKAFAAYLTTDEGRSAKDKALRAWLVERGWPPTKLKIWSERVAALVALSDPTAADPRVLAARLDARFERLAFRAEERNDIKHAIEATKAQAQLNKLGGFSPQGAATSVTVNVTRGSAHLVSDDDLAKVVEAAVVPEPSPSPEDILS